MTHRTQLVYSKLLVEQVQVQVQGYAQAKSEMIVTLCIRCKFTD